LAGADHDLPFFELTPCGSEHVAQADARALRPGEERSRERGGLNVRRGQVKLGADRGPVEVIDDRRA
jgi:hypothetical protein